MIAVDTNLLVYAHRRDSQWHEPAGTSLRELAQSASPWAIPWPCLHEFYAVVTHPRIYDPPTTTAQALAQIAAWLESPSLVLIAENGESWTVLKDVLRSAKVTGPRVHDARVAAMCLANGVRELWTADRDFLRIPQLHTQNPLV